MNILKNLTVNNIMRPISLHIILFLFLKYTQKRTEKILSSINQKNYGTILTKYYKSICCSKPGEMQKTNFWILLQQLLKINENYTNGDILHHKRIHSAQTYNTGKHRLSNYQISLLNIVVAIITVIKNTHFPSLFLLPSSFPDNQYSSSSTTHQYNNPK